VNIEGEKHNSLPNEMVQPGPISTESQQKSQKIADTFEVIDVQGQKDTGIWVHHPGSEISQAWEPRKGKSRHSDTEILPLETPRSSKELSLHTDSSSSSEESNDGHRTKRGNIFQRGIQKLFHSHSHKHSRNEDSSNSFANSVPSPHSNVKPRHVKRVGVKLVMGDGISSSIISAKTPKFGDADEEVPVSSDSSDEEDSPLPSLHDPSLGRIPISSSFVSRDANDVEVEPENPIGEADSDVAVEQDVEVNSRSERNDEVPIQESLKPSLD